ncbi:MULTISPECIES: AAA family ATPase [Helicobacter]|uniref:AAA family ATPase n=1 Tax=Helicobacter TaxID=209 RepID=UPI0001A289C8|nr:MULTISPECIES: AAA family ATPase [Helicobacter]
MLIQRLLELLASGNKALYISLDYPFLSSFNLSEFAFCFAESGGEYLLLDEIHKYSDFASHLKAIFDLSDLKVLFTGSCAISILNAKSDLSRRVSLYSLDGLSFREFLTLKHNMEYERFSLENILQYHTEITQSLSINLKDFKEYLQIGYYPFYFAKKSLYMESLLNTINLSIEIDLTTLGLIEQKYTYKLKKLLEVIAMSEPFTINYTKIATLAEISRTKLYDYLSYLRDARLINILDLHTQGLSKISKPNKIYLNNTNLAYVYKDTKIGNLRETFFVNQVSNAYKIEVSTQGDFIVDNRYIFEIGGKNKSFTQIKDLANSYLILDDIAKGDGNKIPLWLFGFLY